MGGNRGRGGIDRDTPRYQIDALDRELVRLMHSHALRVGIWLTPSGLRLSVEDYDKLKKYAKALKGLAGMVGGFRCSTGTILWSRSGG